MLRTKSFLEDKESNDGVRVSVMRNHLKPRTLQPDLDIPEGSYDLWKPSLAPHPSLLQGLKNEEISLEKFTDEYSGYLRHPTNAAQIHQLAQVALEETVTLLSKEISPHPYRVILASCISHLYPRIETENR